MRSDGIDYAKSQIEEILKPYRYQYKESMTKANETYDKFESEEIVERIRVWAEVFRIIELIQSEDYTGIIYNRVDKLLGLYNEQTLDYSDIFKNLRYENDVDSDISDLKIMSEIFDTFENYNPQGEIKVNEFTLIQIYIWFLHGIRSNEIELTKLKEKLAFLISTYNLLKIEQDSHLETTLGYP